MIRYIPGGLESVLNDKANIALVEQIEQEFFSSDLIFPDKCKRNRRSYRV